MTGGQWCEQKIEERLDCDWREDDAEQDQQRGRQDLLHWPPQLADPVDALKLSQVVHARAQWLECVVDSARRQRQWGQRRQIAGAVHLGQLTPVVGVGELVVGQQLRAPFVQSLDFLVLGRAGNVALDAVLLFQGIAFLPDRLPLNVQAGVALAQELQLGALGLRRLRGQQSQFGVLQPVAFLLQQPDGAVDLEGLQLRAYDGLTRKNRRQTGKWLAFQPFTRDFAVHRRNAGFQRGQRCRPQPGGAGIDLKRQLLE